MMTPRVMALILVLGAVVTTLLVVAWDGSKAAYYALPVIWISAIVPAILLLLADRKIRRQGGDA
jgi:hypothetical protein